MYSEDTYSATLDLAARELRRADRDKLVRDKGIRLMGGKMQVAYFTDRYEIHPDDGSFQPEDISIIERILLLHYLTTWNDFSPRGQLIQFKNLPGVSFYEPTYRKRSTDRLARTFGENPEALLTAGERLGGSPAGLGDASIRILVLPLIAATVVIHGGDEEFPPEASILYDDAVGVHLPPEDVAVVAGVLATRLKKAIPPQA